MNTTIRRLSHASVAVTLVALLVACSKPKAGGKCKTDGQETCVDEKNALVCVGAKWEPIACRGLNGCMNMGIGPGGEGHCTNDGFQEGEPCPKDEGNPGCSADKKAMLKCTGKHWKKVQECLGQNGCVANAEGTRCDMGTQTEGATCDKRNEGNASCAPDKKALLLCKAGKMIVASKCGGQHGCRQMGTKIDCDASIADVGDVCDEEGRSACNAEKKALLKCKGGKMVKEKACGRCTVFLDHIDCGS